MSLTGYLSQTLIFTTFFMATVSAPPLCGGRHRWWLRRCVYAAAGFLCLLVVSTVSARASWNGCGAALTYWRWEPHFDAEASGFWRLSRIRWVGLPA